MKYTVDGTDCHCCGHSGATLPVCDFQIYDSSGNLTSSATSHTRTLTHSTYNNTAPHDFYSIETFEHGATINDWSASLGTIHITDCIRVDLQLVNAGDFTSGLHFWPKSPDEATFFNPQTHQNGYQFKFIETRGRIRNALVTGEQYYESRLGSGDDAPDASLPLPFFAVVVEYDGTLHYKIVNVNTFNRCWQGMGSVSWGNMPLPPFAVTANSHTLGSNGEPTDETIENWCFPTGATPNVSRIGFAVGLTTWNNTGTWTSISIANKTYRQQFWLDDLIASSCWSNLCWCYHHSLTTLNMTFNAGSKPVEFAGQTVTLTRSPDTVANQGNEYTGTVSATVAGQADVQKIPQFDGTGHHPSINYNRIRFRYGNDGDYGNALIVDSVAGTPTASDIQGNLEGILGAGNVACSGGPLPSADVTVTHSGNVLRDVIVSAFGEYNGPLPENIGWHQPRMLSRRVTPGRAAGVLSAELSLTIHPSNLAPGTDNTTGRVNRSCLTFVIDFGPFSCTFNSAGGIGGGLPSHDPVALNFSDTGTPDGRLNEINSWRASYITGSPDTCRDMDLMELGYMPQTVPFDGPPAVTPWINAIEGYGWNIDVTE